MCGISGIYHYGLTQPVSKALLQDMNDTLTHRGPDGKGLFIKKQIGLAHRRLSIIDLKEGDQPIYNSSGSMVIVFNGEIYNYKELKADLKKRGYQFKTNSDTEVIVHLYEDLGTRCLEQLNGMFAFAIWDSEKNRLFLARDRLGEKPLYYADIGGRLVFASELKAVLKDPSINCDIDITAVDDYLAYGYVPCPKSIVKKVLKLPPAHYMLLEGESLKIEKYWTLSIQEPLHPQTETEYKEEFTRLINDSVRLRLRSDVPIGAFLSGGIDSSLTVALAASHSSEPISTFSVGFKEQDFDELRYAKIVAKRYNTKHHEIILDEIDLSVFPEIVRHFDEPFGDPSAIPTYLVTREAARHVKVCLSGDAGDEFFCGYDRYNYESCERGLDLIPAFIRKPLFNTLAKILPNHVSGKGRLQRMAESGFARWQGKVGAFSPSERMALFHPEHHTAMTKEAWLFKRHFEDGKMDFISRCMMADQATYLPDDILVKVDRNSMLHGLEVRVPFLDHHVVEFANSLPFEMKKKNGIQKYLIKTVLRDLVPETILTRPKMGFGLPLKYWLQKKYYGYLRELLLSPDSRSSAYFNKQVIEKWVEDNSRGRRDLSRRLWTLMWFEQWLRGFDG